MSSPVDRRSGHGRTVLLAAVALAALLVVVALASRGQLGPESSSEGRGRPGLPSGAFAYVYAGLLVFGLLGLPFFVYIYARETPYSRSRRRRARLAPFVLVAAAGVAMFVATRWGADIRAALQDFDLWPGGGSPPRPDRPSAATPPAPEWVPLFVVSSAVVAAVAGFVGWRFVRRRLRPQSLAATLSDALGDTLDDVADEPDPCRAIILAYARMEAALDGSGCSRREADAPLEYLARVLLELDVAPGPVGTLTELFERAKFSHHPIDPAMKQRAIEALQAIRAELRERD